MNDNKLFYDLKAKEYAAEWYENESMQPSIKEFLGLFNSDNPLILDLGCGPGNESYRLQKSGASVVGLDYSPESIKIACEKNPDITFYEMDYFHIDSKLGQFDGIFSCSSLIHLTKSEIEIVLDRINLILKKEGLFLVIYRIGKGRIIQNHDINGIKIQRVIEQFLEDEIIELFKSKGFIFVKQGILENSLSNSWDSLIFKKMK